MKRLLNQLTPFIILAVAIVTLVFGAVLLAYLFVFGAIVWTILYLFNYIRIRLFIKTKPASSKTKNGRVIDSDDWKILP